MNSDTHTAGIILAAGLSMRFGHPKQLLKLKERSLVEWVVAAALDSRLQTVILVLGHEHQKIKEAVGKKMCHEKLEVVVNHRYDEGQSTSLQTGLALVREAFSSVMYLLADQPMIDADTIDYLLDQFHDSDKEICVPVVEGLRGNPTIFKQSVYEEIMMIEGDIGARNIIQKNPERVLEVAVKNPLCFFDIDLPEDLARLQRLIQ